MTISTTLLALDWQAGAEGQHRRLSGTERFWNFAQRSLDGAFDMVSLFQLEASSSASRCGVEEWRRAWSMLKRVEPVTACRVDGEGERLVADSGAGQGVEVERYEAKSTSTEMVDVCLQRRRFDRFQLWLFFDNASADQPADQREERVAWVAITNGHALADAMAVSRLFLRLIDLLLDSSTGDKDDTEGRLPPCLAVALRQEPNAERIGEMAAVARMPTTTGIPVLPKPVGGAAPSSCWRRLHTLSSAQTASLLSTGKAHGTTLSSFLQSAIYHSILSLPPRGGEIAATERFTVPAMLFSRMSSLAVEERGAFMATTFAPTSVEVRRDGDVWTTAHEVRKSFADALHMDPAAQETYVGAMIAMVQAAATPTTAIPTLSSLGPLDAAGEAGWSQVKSYEVASRNNQPSLGVHAWSLHGRLCFSLAWCPGRFDQDALKLFWDGLVRIVHEHAVGSS
ncbi:acetyltransferase [Pseudozyma flocculosa PF-1]|uniref:Uncharacterized protein n=1 Tax=Pseudozyma flocculosa TaxID=84751 RepID=A0A5C3EW01_9BASI|nr:acetyltransferase [Pseudozyma flocculosa PF-1]EPQ31823.1 acetyltransferase [Pseudozyma flocculosa PF-1]SPO35281.1 uncharacterized protein PSFLO_00752 [Pseudozyma flocculosa]